MRTDQAHRRLRPGRGVVAVAMMVLGVGAVAAGLASDDAIAPRSGLIAMGPAKPDRRLATPARHTGPQGRVGQFVVGCPYSHSAPNDPIVHPFHAGRSHRHDFYGSVATDADTPAKDLLGAETTCDKKVDTAAYWHPTLYDGDEAIDPVKIAAYYRAAPGIDPTTVQTMPVGLALIAGDQTATEPQEGEATGWTCGSNSVLSDDPPTCGSTAPLHLVLTFQDCWDGVHLDSDDHQSHVAYSTDGQCPGGYPVSIPQLTMAVGFPVWGEGRDLSLASGNIYSAHGDFWNAWDPEGLEREIDACIRRGAVCDLATNRDEDPIFAGP